MHPNAQARAQALATLYRALEAKPRDGWVPERDLTDAHGREIEFHLVALAELGHARRDGFRWRITGPGLIAAEAG